MLTEGSYAQFSPDNKKIVVSPSENSILIYDIATNKLTNLTTKIDLPRLQTPAWNARSNAIIFSSGTFPNIGLYQFNLDNQRSEPIIISEGLRYGCVSSPDGKKIAYRCVKGTDKNRERGIAVYDLIKKEERYVSGIGEYCTWSPDGNQLAFHWPDSSGSFCLYIVNSDGTGLKKIAGSDGNDYELPCWSADVRIIYFQTNKRRGNWEIWSMNKDGSDQKPVIWE